MEQKWKLATNDGHQIYGVANSSGEPCTQAIFIVHGLTGHMNEYVHKRAADHFSAEYDVFRFNLYDGAPDARNLVDCTVQTHADDLNTVLGYFGHRYEKIFIIGHSYGGPTIMLAQPQKVTAVSLWDPTFDAKKLWEDMPLAPLPNTDFYVTQWGTSSLIGKALNDEARKFDEQFCNDLSQLFPAPIQVVTAQDGYYADRPVSWHTHAKAGGIRDYVAGTEHCFYEDRTCDELLYKTSVWFSKF